MGGVAILSPTSAVVGESQPNGPASVWLTTDGGLSWRKRSLTGTAPDAVPFNLTFADPLYGWAFVEYPGGGGADGVYRTSDGGTQWKQIVATGTLPGLLYHVTFRSDSVGYAYGPGPLLITRDGGQSWQEYHLPTLSVGDALPTVEYMRFFGSGLGVAVDSFQDPRSTVTFRTVDGGLRWTAGQVLPPPPQPRASGWSPVDFSDAMHGWAMEGGYEAFTGNGGATWRVRRRPGVACTVPGEEGCGAGGWSALDFISSERGWGLDAQLLSTVDAGQAWRVVPTVFTSIAHYDVSVPRTVRACLARTGDCP